MTTTTWATGDADASPSRAASAGRTGGRPPRGHTKLLWLRITAAVVVSIVMAFPLYWMLLTAFSTRADLYAPGLHLWPQHITIQNFVRPFSEFPIWRWFANSLVISVVVTIITVVCNLLAGYAFAKLPFRGRNALFLVLLSTLMIPPQAIIVPQFLISIGLHLYGGIWAVILPESAAIFGVFLARQFFIAVPDELIEAARIDGAGQFRVFFSVVLPLCRPLLAVLVLLTFMGEWNAFGWPLVALSGNQDLFTVPIGIVGTLQGQYTSDYGAIMAVNLLMIVPIVALFLAFQRYFVEGLSRSGLR
ncbi:carbohydrate ABC transporter permease [Curtobacterium sp. RRHDQ10]|uniref:carbohydrate ABC transporter permease n=1 Tax=Curtobacterium phyllosphaerae TaxID=3413379 RepID=UPI003BF383D2